MRLFAIIGLLLCATITGRAQERWTLQQCIQYAVQHNVQLKLSEINIAQNKIAEAQTASSKYPNVNMGFSNGLSFGRSINPTTNQFIQQGYYFNGWSINSDVLLFGWFSRKYQAQQNTLQTMASQKQYAQLQNDLGLNIATAYLRILLAKEQNKIAQQQLSSDMQQAALISKRVQAGSLPSLNLAQINAQVSQDSSTLVNSALDVITALNDLKSILNVDMATTIDIATPDISTMDQQLALYPDPAEIFKTASVQQHRLQQGNYGVQAAQQQVRIAEAAKRPTVSAGWSLGTNFASTVKDITGFTQIGEETVGNVKFGDSSIPITRPTYTYQTRLQPVFQQYGNNMRQSLNVNVSIPIFNGYQAKYNIERAKLGVQQQQLQLQQSTQQLQQEVYKAYTDYLASIQRHNAANHQVRSAALALDFAKKRLDAGLLPTQEYITQQNTLQRAQIAAVQSKYEAVFKAKILDFYLNKPIQF
jgi:outer membrane protein